MGVKDLWIVASPVGEIEMLSSLSGQVLAIDLSCWICDSQKAKMGGAVVRPHLRNLFFRTTTLLNNGITPIFVIEGEAPQMKVATIQKRCQNKMAFSKNSCKRTRLKGFLLQCCELLDLLGVPWVQAKGEGEATCAALNYFGIVDAVVTQDSDLFLYGGNCVLRNFSANKQKATFDKFTLVKLSAAFGLTRDIMILMAVLLGCDYLPAGIPGIGKEIFLQLVQHWQSIGVKDPIKRFREWKYMKNSREEKGKKNVEDIIRRKATSHPNYPFDDIIEEFQQKMEKPNIEVALRKPKLMELVKFLSRMLEWEACYCIEKCTPVLTLWMINNTCQSSNIKFERIVKKRVHQGIPSLEIEWNLLDDFAILGLQQVDPVRTIEVSSHFDRLFPKAVSHFQDSILKAKKSKKASNAKTKPRTVDAFLETRPVDQIIDDSIDEKDLSAIVERLVNLKMTDDQSEKVITKTDEVVICISDDDDKPTIAECAAANLSTSSDDLFAAMDINTSSSFNSGSAAYVDKPPLNVLDSSYLSELDDTTAESNLHYINNEYSNTKCPPINSSMPDKPTFKLFQSPNFLSSSCLPNRLPVQETGTPQKPELRDSFALDSPEVSLMQRLKQKYGADLGKSVAHLLPDN